MDIEPSDLRISDSEREDAISKLGEHMSVGRLGVDEYGERTARVAAAKTRGELLALFADLPDPRPVFGQAVSAPSPAPAAAPAAAPATRTGDDRPVIQRVWGALVPLSALLALVLFLNVEALHHWYVFLLPAAIAIIGGAVWGEDWRHDRHRHRHHGHHGHQGHRHGHPHDWRDRRRLGRD